MTGNPDYQWFKSIGPCCRCRKAGHGEMMNRYNASMGVFCTRCAAAALKVAEVLRHNERLKGT